MPAGSHAEPAVTGLACQTLADDRVFHLTGLPAGRQVRAVHGRVHRPKDRNGFCAAGGRSHYMAEALAAEGIKAVSIYSGISAVNAYLKKNSHANNA